MMRVAFRTDASIEIGAGHVMRCLSLADGLRARGAECQFICRQHAGSLLDLIVHRGHRAVSLPLTSIIGTVEDSEINPPHSHWLGRDWASDAVETLDALDGVCVDWLIVDHYALDARWENALRTGVQRLMAIDDLADRSHDCDLLLDQNLGRTASDYSGRIPAGATTLIGPDFALLRPEFAQLRAESLARRSIPQLRRLLVTMGGVDKANATGRVLDVLNHSCLDQDIDITVVMGRRAPWLENVQEQSRQMRHPTRVLVGVDNMARLMADSDLAIGAAGGTSWERCCMGLPSIVFVLAQNQLLGAEALESHGAAFVIQDTSEIHNILNANFISSPEALQTMSHAAMQITDGLGTRRVTRMLMRHNG